MHSIEVDSSVSYVIPSDSSVSLVSLKEMLSYEGTDNYTMKTVQQQIIKTALQKKNAKNDETVNLIKKNGRNKMEVRDSNDELFWKPSTKYDYVKSKVDSNLHNRRHKKQNEDGRHDGNFMNTDTVTDEKRVQSNVIWRDTITLPNYQRMRSFSASPQIQQNQVDNHLIEPIKSFHLPYRAKSASVDGLPEASLSALMPSNFDSYIKASDSLNERKSTNDSMRLYKSYLKDRRSKNATDQQDSFERSSFDSVSTGYTDYNNNLKHQETQSRYPEAFSNVFAYLNIKPPLHQPKPPYPKPHQLAEQQIFYRSLNDSWADKNIPVLKPLKSNHFPNRPYSEQHTTSKSMLENQNGLILRSRPASEYDSSAVRHSLPDFTLNKPVESQYLPQNRQSYAEYFNFKSDYLKENEESEKVQQNSSMLSQKAGIILERLQKRHNLHQQEQKLKEEERLLEQKRLQEQRLLERKRIEEQRLLEQRRIEEQRLLEQKRFEEQHLQKRMEEQRLIEQKRFEEQRLLEQKRIEKQRKLEQKLNHEQHRVKANGIIEKAELTLAENIRFLQQLKQNSLPPLKNYTTSSNQLPDTTHINNNFQWNTPKLPLVPSLKRNTGLSVSMPEFLNYTHDFLNNQNKSLKTPKANKRKKSVRIALENNRLHLYTPEIW